MTLRGIVARKGVPVTFTRTAVDTYDPGTDTTTHYSQSVVGRAIRGDGDPARYLALNLIASEAPTLLFSPTTLGQLPSAGFMVVWDGSTYTVRDVDPIAPQGTALVAKVIISGGGREHVDDPIFVADELAGEEVF